MRIKITWLCVMVVFAASCGKSDGFVKMDASRTGVDFQNKILETPENNIMTYQYMYNGAGVAAGDINNDGLPDLYVAGNSVPNKMFLNKGDWKFEDITQRASLNDRAGDWKTGVTMADVNGDGWLDIYVCYSGNTRGEGLKKPVIVNNPHRTNQLFISNGARPGAVPTFTERAREFGLDAPGTYSTQSYFLDYDRDGDLDMFLLNHANTFYSSLFNTTKLRLLRHPYFGNKLYRNDVSENGTMHFTEVSEQAGLHGSGLNYGLSAAISDINSDGWPDIYVTNDYDEQDFCYLNNRDGTFKEISKQAFSHMSKYSMGSDAADINNDLRPDIYVVDMLPEDNHRQKLLKGPDLYDKYTLAVDSGYHHQNMRNTLQLNYGSEGDSMPVFSETGQMMGLSNTDWSWGALIADFDNDGWKDVFVTNGYLHDYTNMDFLKFMQSEIGPYTEAGVKNQNLLPLVQMMPSTKLSSYMLRHDGDMNFKNVTKDWSLNDRSISNGVAYADFDNDGDLDLVVNRLDDAFAMYQNKAAAKENKYIKLKLVGTAPNTNAIGAKVFVRTKDHQILQEAFYSRGYESSVEPIMTIGVGRVDTIDEITVVWPDGLMSTKKNVLTNQALSFRQSESRSSQTNIVNTSTPALFQEVGQRSGIDYKHVENNFVDFKVQRLIPYQASRLGARMAVGDVNKDGNDDVYFGASAGYAGKLYLGKDDGTFMMSSSQPWEQDKHSEDMDALFFDADGDGDDDLYVVSGGNEYGSGDPMYHDRLYINDGMGSFNKDPNALPSHETTSGSCVVAADYDKDGDLDLFVGGRIAAQMYPITPKSYVLRNDSRKGAVKFTDVTTTLNSDLQLTGMVTDARWLDIDKDGWEDLILVGEWMPVRVYRNKQGKGFEEISRSIGFNDTEGWWSSLHAADVDADGDMDLLLGNAGRNLQYRASQDEPLEFFVQDVNGDGGPDPIMTYYIQGRSYPAATLDELTEQMPGLRKKFLKYAQYADATIEDVMDEKMLEGAFRLKIVNLQSSWAENKGDGRFEVKALPDAVQRSMLNGFVFDDFDGDGKKEVLCAGNFYSYKVEWGRSDAFMGAMLKFENGKASIYKPGHALWLRGDIRDLAMLRSRAGAPLVLASRNNDSVGIWRMK